jgi:Helix-turn-helix.
VYKQTGISDSILSRIENGDNKEPSPTVLRQLSNLYGIKIVELYIMCGYIKREDLADYQQCFHGMESLTDEEKDLIQNEIIIFGKKNGAVSK